MRTDYIRVLGDGTNTKFWEDYWGEGENLREKFGRLFRLSEQKEALISEVGKWVNWTWEWDFKWSRPLSSRHLIYYNELLSFVSRYKLQTGGSDFWKWRHNPLGQYSVSAAYGLLQARKELAVILVSEKKMYKKLWRSWATKKAVTTAWKLLKGKMATSDNLIRRGIILDDEAKICQLCKVREENIRHLFFECKVSYQIWCNIIKWLGVSMVFHVNPSSHFMMFENCMGRGKKAKVAASIWTGIVWNIWSLRNEVIFNKAEINVERETIKLKANVRNWISTYEPRLIDCNIGSWFENPMECINLL
ncbi:hypothetical protein ACS0TY_032010 [Phlomoides rotata]